MPPLSTIVYIGIGISALLLAILAVRPGITRSAEGKLLAAVALFLAPAFTVYGGVSEHLDRQKTTEYCLSCHVMSDYGKSMRVEDPAFLAAAHYQSGLVPRERACQSCHADYSWSGDMRAKARGFKHVMKTYFGAVADTIRISRRHANRECLGCHVGSRSFEESITHLTGPVPMAEIKAGRTSCTKSGCHDLVHEVHELDQLTFWDPRSPQTWEARAASTGAAPAATGGGSDSTALSPGSRPQ